MMASRTAAYGMYPPTTALPEVVHTLNREGFGNEDICMVLSPEHPIATLVRDARIVDAACGEGDDSVRAIGWFSEFGAVVIPTVGFFIRSQAYFQALLLEQDFPTLSRDCRTLAGLGFSELDAKRLEHQLSDIGALVYVACPESARTDCAIELLRRTGAHEAASVAKAKAADATS